MHAFGLSSWQPNIDYWGNGLYSNALSKLKRVRVANCKYSLLILASIGIVQNLTSENYYSSAYLRAHFRKEKGLPLLVEKIADESRTISNTAIISLRNLAVDLKNKELIGKYGMGEVCANIPDAKQVHFLALYFWTNNFFMNRPLLMTKSD